MPHTHSTNAQAEAFKNLVKRLREALREPEQFTLSYAAESSAFVRFNHGKVRQAGQVQQASIGLKLINEGRHADLDITLSGDAKVDAERLAEGLQQLRETLPLLPPDPYLLLNYNGWQSSNVQAHPLPDTAQVIEEISRAGEGLDLVGIYAAGPISRGFASSAGAFGWHQANSFNFDFSLFHANGQAVKASYAGHDWNSEGFARRFAQAREQLAFLGRPLRTLAPGQYRAYLAPAALEEIMGMLCWGGFSAQSIASKSSPLQKLYGGDQSFSPLVSVDEQVSGSLSPAFSDEGYPRSDLKLITEGRGDAQLVNSRSAAEYGLTANGASSYESPSALEHGGWHVARGRSAQATGHRAVHQQPVVPELLRPAGRALDRHDPLRHLLGGERRDPGTGQHHALRRQRLQLAGVAARSVDHGAGTVAVGEHL